MTLNYATSGNGAPSTNRINTDSQSFSYSYDAAGNMTAGMGQSFTYDGANRLKTAGNGNSSFGYDGDGTRVKKSENGANTFYVKSSVLGQTAMEVNSTGVMRAFVYSGGKLVAMQGTDGQFYWLHTNHLGNARTMTDTNGNVAYGGQFDPYGQTLAEWSATGNTTLNTKKFTGYERDAATGLDYAQARMYNSSRGRFTSPDPIGLKSADMAKPQSLNRYAYTENDPVNFIDPTGNDGVNAIAWYVYYSLIIRDSVTVSAAVDSYLAFLYWLFESSEGRPLVPYDIEEDNEDRNDFLEGVNWNEIEQGAALGEGAFGAATALDKESCSNLFKGHLVGFTSAKDMLNTYMNNGLIEISDTYRQNGNQGARIAFNNAGVGARTTYATGSFTTAKGTRISANVIIVNSQSFHMTGTLNNKPVNTLEGRGFEGMTLAQIRAAVILHELLHAAGAIPSDGTNNQQSLANSELVRKNCFSN